METRCHKLAVLQSIRIANKGKQLKTVIIGKGLWYIVITVIITLTIGSLITYGIVTGIAYQMWFFTYYFMITPVLICIPDLILMSIIIPII